MKRYLLGLAVGVMALAMVAQGQDQAPPPQDQAAAPQDQAAPQSEAAPGVARVSMIRGDVSTQRGDSNDWLAATLNTPVNAGDRVGTAAGARAEVQLDYANILRLDQNSVATIANISGNQTQVQVGQGLVSYSVLKGSEAKAEIDTPNVAVHPLKDGDYRVQVDSDSQSEVIVRRGAADITTPQGTTRVESGQMITIRGTDSPQYQVAQAPGRDDFDRFNNERDHVISSADSWRHTNRYYTGSEDLDAYGHWQSAPDYGSVWVPAVRPGWTPYSTGRWVWEPYYGWTWVAGEPWGWAPYHYGRWFLYGNSWAWWPGPVFGAPFYRPIWAPAYVSFFGFGGGFGFGFGFGNFGWLPIGPGDFFHPWWGRGFNRVNVVNITNIRNIHNGVAPLLGRSGVRGASNLNGALTNPRIRQAISTMPANQFGKGRVPTQTHSVDAKTFQGASAMTGRMPVVPTKESLRTSDRQASPSSMHGRAGNAQHFFGKTPAAPPRPFNEQAAQVQKMVQESKASAANSAGQKGNTATAAPGARPQATAPGNNNAARTTRNSNPSAPGSTSSVNRGATTSKPGAPGTAGRPNSSGTAQKTGGWQPFKPRTAPPSQSVNRASKPTVPSGTTTRPGGQTFPSRPETARPAAPGRTGTTAAPRQSAKSTTSRPPLDLHRPIVTPRSTPSYSAPRGNPGGSPSHGGGGSSRPPASSAPSRPSGGSQGGHPSGGHPGSQDAGNSKR
jgi:FecR protein